MQYVEALDVLPTACHTDVQCNGKPASSRALLQTEANYNIIVGHA